jgi:hypothetical protein
VTTKEGAKWERRNYISARQSNFTCDSNPLAARDLAKSDAHLFLLSAGRMFHNYGTAGICVANGSRQIVSLLSAAESESILSVQELLI